MTKAQSLRAEIRALSDEYNKRMLEACKEEFPVGTPVRWIYTFNRRSEPVYRHGVVHRYGHCLSVEVKAKSGVIHERNVCDLEAPAEAEGGAA